MDAATSCLLQQLDARIKHKSILLMQLTEAEKDTLLNPMQLGIRGEEWIILLIVIGVFFFGANKIPEMARSIGRARGEFERGKMEMEDEMRKAREEANRQPTEREKLEKAATSFGIPTEGKTDQELREALKNAIEKSP